MAAFQDVAKQFVDHYYNTFDTNRGALAPLYRENSMLTFQSAQVLGAGGIAEKLASLPFQKVKHEIRSFESQPTPSDGIIILVAGALLVDDEQNPLNYAQSFQLSKDPSGNWFIFNDIFTLLV
ncbi:nuclear transport factor 2 [Naviculisporaceae sp. PSN 640]